MQPHQRLSAGFSLLEIAIALVVISLLSAGLIKALNTQLAFGRGSQAREQLRDAREALINYAIANQRLPCPASDLAGIAQAACGSTPKGYLPWQDLGLPMRDVWGQNLRYAVTGAFTSTGFDFNTTGSLLLYQGTSKLDNSNAVAFVIWSTGSDARDASTGTNNVITVEAANSDDIVEWVSRYLLFGKMLNAGRSLSFSTSSAAAP